MTLLVSLTLWAITIGGTFVAGYFIGRGDAERETRDREERRAALHCGERKR